jgi:hypothetical protein
MLKHIKQIVNITSINVKMNSNNYSTVNTKENMFVCEYFVANVVGYCSMSKIKRLKHLNN